MRSSLRQFSEFVSELNENAQHTDAHGLAGWVVDRLSKTVGFDCAWYGWADVKPEGVQIHAQSSYNLADSFYESWCEMSEQDLLAAAIIDNPAQTAVYDRLGKKQTDGMISLADNYGLKKMATSMKLRPCRTASFYLSSYRAGRHSRAWSSEELDYLQCAVEQLSSAMKSSTVEPRAHDCEHSMFVNQDGIVILGLHNAHKQWSTLWPDWSDDQLPEHLFNLIHVAGEHVLVDRQLIVKCEPASGINNMGLRKLTLRNLTKLDLLTRRERQVALLLTDGNSHKEVARMLGVAPATVRNQTQSIYLKLGVNNRAEMALEVNSSE